MRVPTPQESTSPIARVAQVLASWGRRPFASLSSQVTVLILATTLTSSLAVTWISVQAIDAFFSGQMNEKFPAILRSTAERLNLWYRQVDLDIATFARSETVADGLPQQRGGGSKQLRAAARRELETYLSIVLERFPQYQALFVANRKGAIENWVGPESDLTGELARVELKPGRIHSLASAVHGPVQIATAEINDARGRELGTLNAIMLTDVITSQLITEGLGPNGSITVVSADGSPLASSGGPDVGAVQRGLPAAGEQVVVSEYTNASGDPVVGAALRFDRFGWAIVVEEPFGDAFAPIEHIVRRVITLNLAIVAIGSLVALKIAASVVRPIRSLSDVARDIADGRADVRVPEMPSTQEVQVLTRTFNRMTDELMAQREELQRLAITDELTGLYNHRHFQDQLGEEIKHAERHNEPLSLLLMDIDDFKQLNDAHGHAAGDEVLKHVAHTLRDAIRETDLPARYGGEEFALLLGDTTSSGALGVGERLRIAIENDVIQLASDSGITELSVTVSVGVAQYDGDRVGVFNRADAALYRAKANGKNCVES